MAYSTQEIRDFIASKGIGNDPHAMANFARQYGVTPEQVDAALGVPAGTSQQWLTLNSPGQFAAPNSASEADLQRSIAGGSAYSGNPHQAYQWAQSRGLSSEQADRAFGFAPGTSAQWAQAQGLDWGGTAPAGSGLTTQQPGMPGLGQYQPNTTGSPYAPMAGGNALNFGLQQQGFGAGGMGAGSGFGSASSNPYASNPALPWMADAIGQQVGQNLQRNIMPGIRSAASAAGGLGGSRQGIAEGVAIGDAMTGYGNTLANLYGSQFNQDRNYGLQSDALDYSIWQGNNQVQRQAQQDQIGLANQMLGWNQQLGIGNATQVQNSPLNYWQQFGNQASQFAGLGGSQSQNLQGNPWLGALGGAMTAGKLFGG